jgi:hypothetical protein
MAVTVNEYITTAELDFLAEAVPTGTEVRNKGEATLLEQWDKPGLNAAMARAEKPSSGEFLGGGVSYLVTPPRNQRMEFYDGLQKLTFKDDANVSRVKFYAGKAHMGDMLPMDFLERLGLKLKLSDEIRPGGLASVGADKTQVLVNYLQMNWNKLKEAWMLDLAVRFWSANSDAAKAWSGFFGLFSISSNTTGTFGTQSRANPLYRHQLITGLSADTIEQGFITMERNLNDASVGSGSPNRMCFAGDNVWDKLHSLYLGTTTVAGKINRTWSQDQAKIRAQSIRIGIPPEAFVTPNGTLLMREPIFNYLDRLEAPATSYKNVAAFVDWSHLEFLSGRNMEFLDRGMPIDQQVKFTSLLGSYVLGCDKPTTQGVMVVS